MNEHARPKLRIDKWLWFARVVKTRSLAAKLVQSGHVRVNREKVVQASHGLKLNDVLTIAVHERVRVLEVTAFGDRRGSAEDAALLFTDLSPVPAADCKEPDPTRAPAPDRRPDKRARRDINLFKADLN